MNKDSMLPPNYSYNSDFKMFRIVLNSGESFSVGGKLSEIENLEHHVMYKTGEIIKVHRNTIRTSEVALIIR